LARTIQQLKLKRFFALEQRCHVSDCDNAVVWCVRGSFNVACSDVWQRRVVSTSQ